MRQIKYPRYAVNWKKVAKKTRSLYNVFNVFQNIPEKMQIQGSEC